MCAAQHNQGWDGDADAAWEPWRPGADVWDEEASEQRLTAGPGGEQGDDQGEIPQHPEEEEQHLVVKKSSGLRTEVPDLNVNLLTRGENKILL